jgi:hypothetical protein
VLTSLNSPNDIPDGSRRCHRAGNSIERNCNERAVRYRAVDVQDITVETYNGSKYVRCRTTAVIVRNPNDILDLLAFGVEHDTSLFMLNELNFDHSFYDLSSGFAGKVVQKFSNYHVRTVVLGSFESIQSNRFREFMAEANKGNQLRFTKEADEALRWLMK